MPVVTITLIEGYDDATKRAMERRLTHAVKATIDAPLDGITIIAHEVTASGYMRGGTARTPGTPNPPAAEIVRRYLDALEARDLDTARGLMADGFVMTFPGGVTMRTVEELIEWAAPRYRSVAKTYDRIEEAVSETGVVIYCSGRLSGEWHDGSSFSGIRFIDRFTVAGGKLVDQMVWNDMGEVRAGQGGA